MKNQITLELRKANINPEVNMIVRIEDAIEFVKDLGVDYFLENTTFGIKLKEIVFKLSK